MEDDIDDDYTSEYHNHDATQCSGVAHKVPDEYKTRHGVFSCRQTVVLFTMLCRHVEYTIMSKLCRRKLANDYRCFLSVGYRMPNPTIATGTRQLAEYRYVTSSLKGRHFIMLKMEATTKKLLFEFLHDVPPNYRYTTTGW